MNRKTALKTLGAVAGCTAATVKATNTYAAGDNTPMTLVFRKYEMPMTFIFRECEIGNIVVEKKDGTKITIPFSEIVAALES